MTLPRKTCRDCNLTKSLAVFSRNRKARDGYAPTCNDCTRKRVAKFRRESVGVPSGKRWG